MRFTLLVAAWGCIMAAVLVHSSRLEARLLRADPGALPDNELLMQFGATRGEAIFERHCADCHGMRGRGDPARGIPDLHDEDWLYGAGSVGDIEQVIRYGIRSHHPKAWNLAIMPAYARPRPGAGDAKLFSLTPGSLRDLVEFLFREQGREADGAAADRGAALYAGAGGCYDCHASDARGDSAIGAPDLTDGITLYGDGSRESLTNSIGYGRQGLCPAWVTRISAAGIRETAVFVYSLSHPRSSAKTVPRRDG